MKKKLIITAVIFVLAIAIAVYIQKTGRCFASSGAVEMPQVKELQRDQPVALKFRMVRIAASGCFKGHASESYKDVSCGYRINDADTWQTGNLVVMTDSETDYIVECQIPQLPPDIATPAKLDYYFQYSPWSRPPEKQSATLEIL